MGIIQFIKKLFTKQTIPEVVFTPVTEYFAIFCNKCNLPLMYWHWQESKYDIEQKKKNRTRYCRATKGFAIKCACGHTFNNVKKLSFTEYSLLLSNRCQSVKTMLIEQGRL